MISIRENSFLSDRAGKLVTAFCAVGCLLSAYLLATDLLSRGTALCLTDASCDMVRESRYSRLGGIPVSFLGVAGYLSMVLVAVSAFSKRRKWNFLFFLATVAVSFSAYLTYLELFIIKAVCSWCVISAAIASFVLAAVAVKKKDMAPSSSAGKSLLAGSVIFLFVFAASYSIHSPSPEESSLAESNVYQSSLAEYLSDTGATMYGSFRCVHCRKQKELFGTAFGRIRYVECEEDGPRANPKLCAKKHIKSYPTWEIGGNFHRGLMTLEQLEKLSGYADD